jgi:hypothetical protein
MRLSKSSGGLAVFAAAAFVFAGSASASVTPVTLSAFTVDNPYRGTITDAGSGVMFSNASTNGGTGIFIIDYFNSSSSLPVLTPGRVLSSGGYVGNGGIGFPENFEFTMTMPAPVTEVDMEMGYVKESADGAVTLDAFNTSGGLIGSTVFSPPVAFGSEIPISFSAGSNLISSVTLVPTDIGDVFGNISTTAVPEPTAVATLIGAAALGLRRRRGRRSV